MTTTVTEPEPAPQVVASPSDPDAAGAPLVRVRGLHVRFTGARRVHAVRGISLQVAPGESVALVGESGSGKSVTARTLVGLAGENARVEADELTVVGRDARALSERAWRGIRGVRVGLVLQDALTALDPLRTVGREIGETLRVHRLVARTDRETRVEELLAAAGVPDPAVRARQYPHQLSGGLRQRALIASGLAGEPELLIADEPTTALDVTVQAQVLDLLERRRAQGTALILVSHDLAVVSRIADRVLVMHDGRVLEEGPTGQVLTDPQHPYTRSLLAAVPSAATRGRRLSAAPADVAPLVPLRSPEPATSPSQARGTAAPAAPASTGASATDSAPAPAAPPANPDGTPVLRAEHLTRSFALPHGRRRVVVEDVSLTLGAGEKLGVVGESGSGKSTLARLLLGLLPPDSGTVEVLGRPWRGSGERAVRGAAQFVAQDPLGSFDPRYDVLQVVGEPLRPTTGRVQRRERVTALLAQVGLDESFLAAQPRRLSGGQRQRVAIARALALDPQVLVCDEPVSALDVSIQAQVLDLLRDLNARLGTALVFISHDLGVVHHLVDRVLVMRHGRVVESGDVDDVLHHPGHPYTRALVDAIPRLPGRSARPAPAPLPTAPPEPDAHHSEGES